MEKPLADSNPMLHFQIRTPSTAVRPPTTLFHGLLTRPRDRGNLKYWLARLSVFRGEYPRPHCYEEAPFAQTHGGCDRESAGSCGSLESDVTYRIGWACGQPRSMALHGAT